MNKNDSSLTKTPNGVGYGRIAGRLLGIGLICMGIYLLAIYPDGTFQTFKSIYLIAYGVLLNLPFVCIEEKRWKWFYGFLVLSSIGFVFLMVVSVIFDYIAADARGERLGVPGFEGTLIFIALLQVPLVLFERSPDLLD